MSNTITNININIDPFLRNIANSNCIELLKNATYIESHNDIRFMNINELYLFSLSKRIVSRNQRHNHGQFSNT